MKQSNDEIKLTAHWPKRRMAVGGSLRIMHRVEEAQTFTSTP
jgi:hypothetical protein